MSWSVDGHTVVTAGPLDALDDRLLALGYEGPESVGALVAAATVLVTTVVFTWSIVRFRVAVFAEERTGRRPRSDRRR